MAEWLACWTEDLEVPGSNPARVELFNLVSVTGQIDWGVNAASDSTICRNLAGYKFSYIYIYIYS